MVVVHAKINIHAEKSTSQFGQATAFVNARTKMPSRVVIDRNLLSLRMRSPFRRALPKQDRPNVDVSRQYCAVPGKICACSTHKPGNTGHLSPLKARSDADALRIHCAAAFEYMAECRLYVLVTSGKKSVVSRSPVTISKTRWTLASQSYDAWTCVLEDRWEHLTRASRCRKEFNRTTKPDEDLNDRMDYGFTVLRWLGSGNMYADTILESLKPRSKPVDSKFCIGDIVWHKEYQWRGKAHALVGHFGMKGMSPGNFFWY